MRLLYPKRLPYVLLAATMLLAVAVNLAWHRTHQDPVITGHNTPMTVVWQLHEFFEHPVAEFRALYWGDQKPNYSLYNLTAAIGTGLLGFNHTGVALISTFYYLLLICSVFGIVARLGNKQGAIIAAIAALLMPAAMAWSRVVSSSIAIIAVSAFCVYLLALSEWFTKPWPTLALGLTAWLSTRLGETVSGNFQVLSILSLAACYALVVRFALLRTDTRRALLSLGLGLGAFLLLFNYSYLVFRAMPYLEMEAVDYSDNYYAMGNVLRNPKALATYPFLFWHYHLLPLHCLAVLAAVILLARKLRRENVFALAYLLVPMAIVTLISKKNYNYALAILPAVPVAIGMAASQLKTNRTTIAALLVLGAIGFAQFFWLSFTSGQPAVFTNRVLRNSFVRDTCEIDYAPAFAPFRTRSLAVETARALATYAKENKDASLLIVASGLERPEPMAFRYLLSLADWRGRLRVIDPFYLAQKSKGLDFIPIGTPRPIRPDFLLRFSYGEPMFSGDGFMQYESICAYFHKYPLATKYRTSAEADALCRGVTDLLAEPNWSEYDGIGFPWKMPPDQRETPFQIYQRHDRRLPL